MTGIRGGAAARRLAAVGLTAALAGALAVAGFSSESALVQPFVLDDPLPIGDGSPIWFASAVVVTVLLHLGAWHRVRRGRSGRAFAGGLVAVSLAAATWFCGLAVLGAGFYVAARTGIGAAETVGTGILFVVCFAGPSIASLASAIVLARHVSRESDERAADEQGLGRLEA